MEDGTVPTETSQTSLLVEAPSPPASPAALISLSTTLSPPPLPSLPPLSSSPPPSSSPPLPSLPSLSSSPPPSSSPPLLSLPSLSSSPPSSSPPLPSLLPRPHHARSLRPKPSPPPLSAPRPTQHPPRPPLPPTSAPPSTPTPSSPPPPLSPLLKPPTDPKPPQSLFGGLSPPLSPTPASAPSPLSSSKLPTSSSSFRSSSTLSSPLNPSSSSPLLDPVSLSPFPVSEGTGGFQSTPAMGFRERLIGSSAVWQLKEFSAEKVTRALEREAAGVFLVQSRGDGVTMLSVRLPDGREPSTQHIVVKEYKTFLHLEGSHLVFGSIFKLVIFYCFSRDVLPVTLRLPEVITNATKEELTLISAKPEEFWTLVPGQAVQDGEEEQLENQDIVSVQNYNSQPTPPVAQDQFCFVNPDMVEDHIKNLHPSNDPSAAPSFVLQSPLSSIATVCNVSQTQSATSVFPLQDPPLGMKVASKQENYSDANVQNGETIKKPEVLGQSGKPSTKFKRPPPRPPSLGVPLPSSPCDANASSPLPAEKDKKEEDVKREEEKEKGRVEGGGREKRKSAPASAPPSRPPVPSQIRAPPRLPPAPLRRALSKKSSQGAGEGEECRRETEGHAVKREEEKRAEDKTEQSSTLLVDLLQQDASLHSSQGRNKKEDNEATEKREDGGKEREEEGEAREADKDNVVEQGPNTSIRPSLKKPSRPVPPPRRKPTATRPSLSYPGPLGGGSTNQSTGIKLAPPTAARRPDVSLYSPQGGSVVGMDPDSCSNSSSEEEGEVCQEQEQNQSRSADSYIHKAVKRTSTTIILGRARDHLSSVLTGLISYDRRLTQRIVELARDPLSYFGNLVKEHRMFTLETMSRHLSSTELLQEIRTMMTQLKSYLLQSTELQGMMEPQHQYTQDKLESIAEAALCKSVLKPLREPIYHSLEQLHTDDGGLQQLAQNQSSVLGSTSTALGVTTAVPEAPTMEKISSKLRRLHLEYSPQRKIELLLKTCKIIYDSMSISCPGRAHGADDFLPVLMYVLARSNLAQLKLDVEYMMELMDPSLTLGEGSYYLTTTYGALEHIKSFDQQRAATRQLSREVQDSIHRWERRRTLNKERMAQGSVQDFLTVCCPEIGLNPKALGVLPNTTIQELAEQCAVRFEQESYNISVFVDGVKRPLAPTKLALSVKSSLSPGGYCFVFHPAELSEVQPGNAHPGGLERSLDGRAETCFQASDATQGEVEESLISL